MNYQVDSSFFYVMHIMGNFPWTRLITKWFENNTASRYRLIMDEEYNVDLCHISEVLDTYPGVKIVTVVMNPWLRAYVHYTIVKKIQELDGDNYSHLVKPADASSFENFVKYLVSNPTPNETWYTLSTAQADWIESEDAKADYVLKVENLAENFEPIQQYFRAFDLDLSKENFEVHAEAFVGLMDLIDNYQQFYTDETKEAIAQLWAKDIEQFGYQF